MGSKYGPLFGTWHISGTEAFQIRDHCYGPVVWIASLQRSDNENPKVENPNNVVGTYSEQQDPDRYVPRFSYYMPPNIGCEYWIYTHSHPGVDRI